MNDPAVSRIAFHQDEGHSYGNYSLVVVYPHGMDGFIPLGDFSS